MSGRSHPQPLKVCLDARIWPGLWGGVEPYIMQVGRALLELEAREPGGEEFWFLVHEPSVAWARERLGVTDRLIHDGPVIDAERMGRPDVPSVLKVLRSPRRALRQWGQRRAWDRAARTEAWRRVRNTTPGSSGAIEAAGVDVMHFMHQAGFVTRVPSVYQPHDFQHMHLPELFEERELRWRAGLYPRLCWQARAIVAVSSFVREDTARWTGVPTERIFVLPYPPPLGWYGEPTEADLRAAREKYALPPRYLFYAAQTWAHKNHVNLLRAMALLRERDGVEVPVVCSGHKNEHFAVIEAERAKLGLERLALFPGFVPPLEVRCLYAMATGVVIPTRFEAASYPMWEAFREGRAVCCSNVTALPRQAGDAAVLFDPDDPASIAAGMRKIWDDENLRRTLAERGRANLARFTPERSARAFRALYRMIGGRAMTDEDRAILAEEPML